MHGIYCILHLLITLIIRFARMKPLRIIKPVLKGMAVTSFLLLAACQSTVPEQTVDPVATESPVTAPAEQLEPTATEPVSEEVVVDELAVAPGCECPPVEAPICPAPTVVTTAQGSCSVADKLIVGRVEYISLLPRKLHLKTKIDTGAKTSSLNAIDLTEFERDGKSWVRFAMIEPGTKKKIFFERPIIRKTKVKQLESELQQRPTVRMSIVLGPIEEQVEFTLVDRSGYLYQVLIGRNFLRDRVVVDVSQVFMTGRAQ